VGDAHHPIETAQAKESVALEIALAPRPPQRRFAAAVPRGRAARLGPAVATVAEAEGRCLTEVEGDGLDRAVPCVVCRRRHLPVTVRPSGWGILHLATLGNLGPETLQSSVSVVRHVALTVG